MGCFRDSFVCHVNPFFFPKKVKLHRSRWIIWGTVKRRRVENAEWRVRSSAAVWLPDGVITARGLPKVGLEFCLSHSGHKDDFIHSVWTTNLITQGLYMQQSTGLMYCHAHTNQHVYFVLTGHDDREYMICTLSIFGLAMLYMSIIWQVSWILKRWPVTVVVSNILPMLDSSQYALLRYYLLSRV